MNWIQVLLTIILYIWLFAVLGLLWLHALRSGAKGRYVQQILFDVAQKNADSAKIAAEAARTAVNALLQKDTHD